MRKIRTVRIASAASAISPTLSCAHVVLLTPAIESGAPMPLEFFHVGILSSVQLRLGSGKYYTALIHHEELCVHAAGALHRPHPLDSPTGRIVAKVGHQMPVQVAVGHH